MATSNVVKLDLDIKVDETKSNDLGISRLPHSWQQVVTYASGTGNSQNDLVYSDSGTLAASTDSIDLSGSLTSILDGSAVVFVKIKGFAIKNKSSAESITVGGNANPLVGWVSDATDKVVIPPSGVFVWTGPVAGVAVTAGTGDVLDIASTGNATYDFVIWGTSA